MKKRLLTCFLIFSIFYLQHGLIDENKISEEINPLAEALPEY